MRSLTIYLTLLAVAAGLTGLAVAVWRTRGLAPRGRQLVVASSLAVVVIVVGILLWPRAFDAFGLLHAVYLGVVVAGPVIGLGLGVLALRRGSGALTTTICALLVLPAPIGWYATHIEPNWLRVDEVAVPVAEDRSGSGTIRVAVLSDLQTTSVGDHERQAVREILDAEPDVILLPGDLYQAAAQEYEAGLPELRDLLASLRAPHGVYFVQGDMEGGDAATPLIEGTDIVLLDNRVVEVPVRDRTLLLGGVSLDVGTPAAQAVRDQLLAEPSDGAVTVLLSHRPDNLLKLPPDARVDLSVAGHTHGGQIVLPFFGPPMTLTHVPRAAARGGLHEVDGNLVYVSPGVGVERSQAPQVRLFNRPAVAILELGS